MTWSLAEHAIYSRIFTLGSIWLISRYMTAFDESVLLSDVSKHLHGFLRWDGIFDVAIARYGYRYEQEYAFGPFYPFLIRHLASFCIFCLCHNASATWR